MAWKTGELGEMAPTAAHQNKKTQRQTADCLGCLFGYDETAVSPSLCPLLTRYLHPQCREDFMGLVSKIQACRLGCVTEVSQKKITIRLP